MKDPSAPSSINVNKYFPQLRSITIKDAVKGKKKRERESRQRKNQLVESFAKKRVVVVVMERGYKRGGNRPVKPDE